MDRSSCRRASTGADRAIRFLSRILDRFAKHIVELLKSVRLGLLTTKLFVEKVKCHPYISNNDACKPMVIDTLKHLYELDQSVNRVTRVSKAEFDD
jgi:hypothetical protein